MRKWVIAGSILLILCAIVVVALLNLNSLIKRNQEYLLSQAEQALGRKVAVGDVSVTLWNGIGIKLEKFSMSDDPSFSSGDFVRAKDLQVNVKLLPLLRKEFQVKRLILREPVIVVVRDREGDFNFSTIGKSEKEGKKPKPREKAERAANAKGESKGAPQVLVSVLDISKGEIHYRDRKEGADLRVKALDFQVEDLDFDQPFTVTLAAALFSDRQNFKAETKIGPLGPNPEIGSTPIEGKVDIDQVDFGKLKSALPAIRTALPRELDFSGILTVKNLRFKGTLKKLALAGSLEGTDAAIKFGKNFNKASGVPLVLSTDAKYVPGGLNLSQTKLKLHNMELAGKGDVRLGNVTAVNLALDSNRFSLDGWEKIIPLLQDYQLSGDVEVHTTVRGNVGKGAAPQVQGTLVLAGASVKPPQFPKPVKDLDTKINFTGERATLSDTTLSLGNARIRLAAAIERFAPLTLTYKLSTPEIWPADFQAGLAEDRKADVLKNVSSEGSLSMANGTPTYQGKIASAQGILHQVNYTDLNANLTLENKVANIRDLRVKALKGSLQANGEYAFNDPTPRFSLASKVQGIDIKELYQTLDPKASRDIQGRLNADMKVSGTGKGWEEIKPTLRGDGQAEVIDGAVLNFNIAENALSGITGIPGLTSLINPQLRKKYPETFESKDTHFKEMKGFFNLANSRLNIKELRMAAADFTVRGNGWANFERRLDFDAVLLFSQPLSADLGRSTKELTYAFNSQNQLEIPFVVKGTLPNVKARPDSSYVGKLVQRGFMRRGTDELQRRFFGAKPSSTPDEPQSTEQNKSRKKNSTEDLIRKGLEGLFGR